MKYKTSIKHLVKIINFGGQKTGRNGLIPFLPTRQCMAPELTHSFPTAKQLFPGFFTFFSAIFYFENMNMISMSNSHLILHEETLKQHFDK